MQGELIETKSQFARRIKRDPAFVTRAIADGKVTGDALVGEGRSARIRVDVALRQLNLVLDVGQQLAQAAPILPTAGLFDAGSGDDVGESADAATPELHKAREEQVRLRNQKLRQDVDRGEMEMRSRAGELVSAAAVEQAVSRRLARVGSLFDEVPANVAKAVAEAYGLTYTEVLITVKGALRDQRQRWASEFAPADAPAMAAAE